MTLAAISETTAKVVSKDARMKVRMARVCRNYHHFMPTPHCVYGRCIDCDETEQEGAHFTALDEEGA